MAPTRIKIAVLDNCPVVVRGLRAIFSTAKDMEFKAGFSNLSELTHPINGSPFDILLAEISANEASVEQTITGVRKMLPHVKVLVFSFLDSTYYAKIAMRLGASGYLLKTCAEAELLDAIRTLHAGEQYIEASIKESIFQKALLNKKPLTAQAKLTTREKEILQLLASNYTSQEISTKLFISKKTVENHRSNMLLKLKVKNSASLIKKAIELDLIESW